MSRLYVVGGLTVVTFYLFFCNALKQANKFFLLIFPILFLTISYIYAMDDGHTHPIVFLYPLLFLLILFNPNCSPFSIHVCCPAPATSPTAFTMCEGLVQLATVAVFTTATVVSCSETSIS